MKIGWIKTTFVVSGIYDGLLGVIFFMFGNNIFDVFGVTRPNHIGYIQFPALLLVIFGIMFLRIASDPVRFRELMWYGVALKASYAGVVFYHMVAGGIPFMWVPFAIADSLFLILYLVCLNVVKKYASGSV